MPQPHTRLKTRFGSPVSSANVVSFVKNSFDKVSVNKRRSFVWSSRNVRAQSSAKRPPTRAIPALVGARSLHSTLHAKAATGSQRDPTSWCQGFLLGRFHLHHRSLPCRVVGGRMPIVVRLLFLGPDRLPLKRQPRRRRLRWRLHGLPLRDGLLFLAMLVSLMIESLGLSCWSGLHLRNTLLLLLPLRSRSPSRTVPGRLLLEVDVSGLFQIPAVTFEQVHGMAL
mmetsp:Transcript_45090/g.119670  ORF Transcript_45090/g.119670 Transcript_45090/m.119670 type:complete len:225 (-) Transcript_45090:874-1548(-)